MTNGQTAANQIQSEAVGCWACIPWLMIIKHGLKLLQPIPRSNH